VEFRRRHRAAPEQTHDLGSAVQEQQLTHQQITGHVEIGDVESAGHGVPVPVAGSHHHDTAAPEFPPAVGAVVRATAAGDEDQLEKVVSVCPLRMADLDPLGRDVGATGEDLRPSDEVHWSCPPSCGPPAPRISFVLLLHRASGKGPIRTG
jgi:hypothetical protein